jgi:hypothetical protein
MRSVNGAFPPFDATAVPTALADDGGVGDHEEGLREQAPPPAVPSIVSESWPMALTVPLDRASEPVVAALALVAEFADVRGVGFAGGLVVRDRDGLPHRQHIAQLRARLPSATIFRAVVPAPRLDQRLRVRSEGHQLVGDLDGERGAADLGDGAARRPVPLAPWADAASGDPIRESAVRVTARNVEFMSASLDESRGANK